MATRSTFPRRLHPAPHSEGEQWFRAVARWRDFLEASEMSPVTVSGYRYHLLRFFADTLVPPEAVTEDDVARYLSSIRQEGKGVQQTLRALKSFYGWATRRGVYPVDPASAFRFKEPKRPPPIALSPNEIQQVLAAAKGRHPKRAWTIVLGLETGARIGSLAGVTPDDAGRQAGELIHFRIAKGNRPYAVPLSPAGARAVRELLPYSNGTLVGVKKGSIWAWYHEAAVAVGLPPRKLRAHIMRDTFATALLMRGVDVRTVQELLNHADLSQIHRYVAVTDARRREAVGESVSGDFTG